MINIIRFKSRAQSGFTLVELMIAMLIGSITAIGIVSLFSGTSRSNRLQEGLARLQENGRYASSRIEDDLRRASGQYMNNLSGNRIPSAVAPIWQDRVPWILAANLNLPDSGNMQSVNPTTGALQLGSASAPYPLSTRFLMQGYSCTTGNTCTPALPPTTPFPSAGLSANSRVPNTDILTLRYLRGTGWPVSATSTTCGTGSILSLAPQSGDDPLNITSGSLVLVTDGQSPYVIPIAGVSGNNLTVGTVLGGGTPICRAQLNRDVRVFNFSRDLVTITYYLAFRTNDNPDATPNAGGLRLVPVLVRRENGVAQDIVRGVDALSIRYGVRDNNANMRILTANQVETSLSGAITCPPKPPGVAPSPANTLISEPGCLWRSVRRIEANLLVNSGEAVADLDNIGRSYRFMGTQAYPTASTPLPSGLLAGSFPRREFIAHATHRNRTP